MMKMKRKKKSLGLMMMNKKIPKTIVKVRMRDN